MNDVLLDQEQTKGYIQQKFDHTQEYSPELRRIFSKYLNNKYQNQKCDSKPGSVSTITSHDLNKAIEKAKKRIKKFKQNDTKIISTNPQVLQFSKYLYKAGLDAKYNEYITKALAKRYITLLIAI